MTGCSIQVRGVVQGVGFRPFVFQLAHRNALSGWVRNQESGVDIRIEGPDIAIETFLRDLTTQPPPAAKITSVRVLTAELTGLGDFTIRDTVADHVPIARISPDLPVCEDCLSEMRDPANPRFRYAYINCTNCGPRYSVIEALPYDRATTTMHAWPMDALCLREYEDPANRRFHAQPIACPSCGPQYLLPTADAAALLREGRILAVKGIGGYHFVCDARNQQAVATLRERKFRKEKAFAVMAANVSVAKSLIDLSVQAEALLTSSARPIVLAPAIVDLPHVAPGHDELGVMLPYAPLHYLLFDAGAPDVLVLTSGNRSSEPIAYRDDDARERLTGIADTFLAGERPIARRVDDSVTRAGTFGPVILRRSRGYAPGAVSVLPTNRNILATGADLKNTITLVVDGQAFMSQHIGDLTDYESFRSFRETIRDLTEMYRIESSTLVLAHDAHPEYSSSLYAQDLGGAHRIAVQHHRAHIASVLAERSAWDRRVIGVSFDGTGYGDEGCIWGGEFFHGNVADGFERVRHLHPAKLPGGDATARHPAQCAAGFLHDLPGLPDLCAPPFSFPERYRHAQKLLDANTRVFVTTSAGRLFDAAAALLGFTREVTYEGQAAIWLEQLARRSNTKDIYRFPDLDYRPLLLGVIADRVRGRDRCDIARAFQRSVANGIHRTAVELCEQYSTDVVVLSGGVFQNELLLHDLKALFAEEVWINSAVPPNDGGISLGQAALATFSPELSGHA